MKHFDRATKIVATIGPASRDPEILSQMIDAGLNVVRMNFSHGSHDDHRETYTMVRELAVKKGVTIGILQDLQGPKIRTARFANGSATLVKGQKFVITMEDIEGDETRVGSTYKGLAADVHPGMDLLLDDGNMALRVEGVKGGEITTAVMVGGVLKNNKGINVPQAELSVPAMSDKDVEDMAFGAELGVDWVALSFVRSRDDLLLARHYLSRYGSRAKLMAKIEKPQAVDRFEDILKEVDGIMVARGDLGVEMPLERVPLIQKMIIDRTNVYGKLAIVATQMLESMIVSPQPTRAEVSDVANAILDGTDAVMLSAETAAGKYPIEAVRTMARIVEEVERSSRYLTLPQTPIDQHESSFATAVARACTAAAAQLGIGTICVYTRTGETARLVAEYRPQARIVAFTASEQAYRRMALYWGVNARRVTKPYESTDEMILDIAQTLLASREAMRGEAVVIASAVPPNRATFGASMMQLHRL